MVHVKTLIPLATRFGFVLSLGALISNPSHAALQVGAVGGMDIAGDPDGDADSVQGFGAGLRGALKLGEGFAPEIVVGQSRFTIEFSTSDITTVMNHAFVGTRYFLGKKMVAPFLSAHGGYTSSSYQCDGCENIEADTAFAARGGAGVQIGLGLLYLEGLASYGLVFEEESNMSLLQAGIGIGLGF